MSRVQPGNGNPSFSPSALVQKFAKQIADSSAGYPILDVACGSGRNAFQLADYDCEVICIDRELNRLESLMRLGGSRYRRKLVPYCLDLENDIWPFGEAVAGGIINVHFLLLRLIPLFHRSLRLGSFLLIESEPGCGGNYLQLPKAGELKDALETAFEIKYYKEKKVGPPNRDAVTVKALAVRSEKQTGLR
jgi:SAM-dependent methyltransferase